MRELMLIQGHKPTLLNTLTNEQRWTIPSRNKPASPILPVVKLNIKQKLKNWLSPDCCAYWNVYYIASHNIELH